MRSTLAHSRRWQDSARRIVALVAALSGHLALLMLLLQVNHAARPDDYAPAELSRHSIKLRFIKSVAPLSNVRRASTPTSAAKPVRRPRQRPRAVLATRAITAPAAGTAPSAPRHRAVPHRSEPGYIAGGNLLHGTDLDRQSRVRLPGSGEVIVPGLHMADPRTQGLAGAVRMVQGLLGVPDTHCLRVDTWRSMSTQELLARHVSPRQVERTAVAYHCGPGKQVTRQLQSRCPWTDHRRSLCG